MVRDRTDKPPLIAVRRAGKAYDGKWIFRDVEIGVAAGECVGLIGGNGAGKSTILRSMVGFQALDEGTIYFEDQAVPNNESAWITVRKRVGFLAQSLNLWPYRTALQNIVEGLTHSKGYSRPQAEELAREWADRLDLKDHLHKFPAALSGGEQQRVAIARALVMQPDIVLFDEPASRLDPITTGEVGELIASLRSLGLGMLIVSHQIDFIRRTADWVYFLNGGSICESGRASEVLTAPTTPELTQFIAKIRRGW